MGNRLEAEIDRAYYANAIYIIVAMFVMVYYNKELNAKKMGKFVKAIDRFIQVCNNYNFSLCSSR